MNLPREVKLLIVCLVVLCIVALVYAIRTLDPVTAHELGLFGLFLCLAVLADIYTTRIPAYKWEISSGIAIKLATLFILGISMSILMTFGATLLSELVLRSGRRKGGWSYFIIPASFNVSQLTVTVAGAGFVLHLGGYQTLTLQEPSHYLWAVSAFLCYSVLNWSFVIGIVSLTQHRRFLSSFLLNIRQGYVQYLVLCAVALLITVLYSFSPWHILLGLIPLVLVHASFRNYLKLRTEARKTFEKMAKLLDERDRYTSVHSNGVAELAEKIAREMKLSEEEVEKIDVAARVHDIGKVAVPDSVLLKPGKLSEAEWTTMKRHPVVSSELIEGLEIYAPVADAVRHEHERWDGTGYPDGLKGEQIPLVARVIAAADVYHALITDRPYRKAYTSEEAKRMLREMRETVLDPDVVDALLRVLDAKPA